MSIDFYEMQFNNDKKIIEDQVQKFQEMQRNRQVSPIRTQMLNLGKISRNDLQQTKSDEVVAYQQCHEEEPLTLKDMIKTRLENQSRLKHLSKIRESKFPSQSSAQSFLPANIALKKGVTGTEQNPSSTIGCIVNKEESRSATSNSRIGSQEIQEINSLSRLSGLNEIDEQIVHHVLASDDAKSRSNTISPIRPVTLPQNVDQKNSLRAGIASAAYGGHHDSTHLSNPYPISANDRNQLLKMNSHMVQSASTINSGPQAPPREYSPNKRNEERGLEQQLKAKTNDYP